MLRPAVKALQQGKRPGKKKLKAVTAVEVLRLWGGKMAYVELCSIIGDKSTANKPERALRILVFTEGTILGPRSILQHFNHASYLPIRNAVNLLREWEHQGAEIVYLTSQKTPKNVNEIREILSKHHFPGNQLYYRGSQQQYKDIVELVLPDVLIEDDYRSIGGKWQMTITYVKPEIKNRVKSIVVSEFKGINDLLSLLSDLVGYQPKA